jgi:hypothetical protein
MQDGLPIVAISRSIRRLLVIQIVTITNPIIFWMGVAGAYFCNGFL